MIDKQNVQQRKRRKNIKMSNYKLFLFGRLNNLSKARAYCELHKCYLEGRDIKEKGCNYKTCKHLRELDKKKNIIENTKI